MIAATSAPQNGHVASFSRTCLRHSPHAMSLTSGPWPGLPGAASRRRSRSDAHGSSEGSRSTVHGAAIRSDREGSRGRAKWSVVGYVVARWYFSRRYFRLPLRGREPRRRHRTTTRASITLKTPTPRPLPRPTHPPATRRRKTRQRATRPPETTRTSVSTGATDLARACPPRPAAITSRGRRCRHRHHRHRTSRRPRSPSGVSCGRCPSVRPRRRRAYSGLDRSRRGVR